MVRLKTGVLLGVAFEVGEVVAQAGPERTVFPSESERQSAGCFREAPGATFQLQDDLGVGGQSQCLGKEPNYLTERKGGLPAVLARPKEDTEATMDLYRRLEEMGVEARA